jgi:predicted PurR-regulated permease PerM
MTSDRSQSLLIVLLLVFLLAISFFIIEPYLTSIILAAVFAIAFWPIYEWLSKIIKFKGLGALLMVFLVLVVFLLPLTFIGSRVLGEAYNAYNSIFSENGNAQISSTISWLSQKINEITPAFIAPIDLTGYAKSILEWFVGNLGTIFTGIAKGFFAFILSLFMLFYFFRDGSKMKSFFIKHSPLNEPYNSKLIEKIREAINSVVRGSLVVALLQSIVSGIGFYIFGVPNPSLWGGLTFVAAFVPTLGTSLVILPVIISVFLSGNTIMALGLTVWGILAVGLIDNTLGPMLMGRGMKIHPLVIFIGVLGGVSLFGPMGFVVGPIVFALLYVISDIYFEFIRKNPEISKS